MRGRRSSRSAAVVLAGCVGLAVMAPGLALAAPTGSETTPAACQAAGGRWTPQQKCVAIPTPRPAPRHAARPATGGTTTGSTTSGAASSGTTTTTGNSTTTGSAATDGATTNGGTTGAGATPGGMPAAGAAGAGSAATVPGAGARTTGGAAAGSAPDAGTTATDGTGATATTATGVAPGQDAAQETQTGTATLRKALVQATAGDPAAAATDANAAPAAALLPDDALEALTDALGFDVPTSVPAGGFQDPQQSCAYLAGQLEVPANVDVTGLASQLGAFCKTLPTSFTDTASLTGVIGDLVDLLKHLIPTLPNGQADPGRIPDHAPHGMPDKYWGYWKHHYDVDCSELSYDEANEILAHDPSDPFRLDGDHDGVACDRNWCPDNVVYDEHQVSYVQYESYPVGGVATGDGSTGTPDTSGASGTEVALAAGGLSALGLGGLALVRRFARQG